MAALFADLTMLEWIYLSLFTAGLIYALFLAAFGFGHGSGMEHAGDVGHGDVGLDHGDLHLGDAGHGGLDHGDLHLGEGGLDHGDLHVGDAGHGGLDHGDVHVGEAGHGADAGHGAEGGHGDGGIDHGDMDITDHAPPIHASPWNPLVIASFVGGVGGFGIVGTRVIGLQSFLSLVVALPAGLVLAGIIFGLYVLLISQAGGSSAATWADIRGASGQVVTPIPAKGLGEVVYVARGSRFASAARSVDGRPIPAGTRVTILDAEKAAVVVDVRFTED